MAIRRPPTTFSDTISTADIADDAITTAKVADDQITGALLANDIAISTTGNIATTGSGTLTVAGTSTLTGNSTVGGTLGVTGNTTLSGTNNLGSNPTITLGSNATFPAGQILQTLYDHYESQTTIGNSNTYILTATFTTKGANSRILVQTSFMYGASGDTLGFHGGITSTSGSSASTNYAADYVQRGADTSSNDGRLFGDDIGNGRLNGYGIQMFTAIASKVVSYAKGTQVTVGLWLNGDDTMYINRSEQRANLNEMNISTMVVHEIAQ